MIRLSCFSVIFSVFFILFFVSTGFCGGYRLIDQDPKATARGNAFVATADNPSAVHYNPAGITQLEGTQIQIGYFGTSLDVDYKSPSGTSSSTINKIKGPPQVYGTTEIPESDISFGLGLNSPFGLGLEWRDDTGFRTAVTESELVYLVFSPVVAWEVSEDLSIGAGINLNYGDLVFRQGISPVPMGDSFNFELDGFSTGYKVGLLWQPTSQHSIGFSYTSDSYMTVDGSSFGTGIGSSEAELSLPFPEYLILGYSYRPTEDWNIEVNIDWTNWERLNTGNLNNTPLGDLDLPFSWDSTFAFMLGATRELEGNYWLSAGYYFSENAQPEEFFNPITPDTEKHFVSIGAGQELEEIEWAVAYQILLAEDRDVSGALPSPLGESVDGTYEFTQHSLTFSILLKL